MAEGIGGEGRKPVFTVKNAIRVGLFWAAEYALLSLIEEAPRVVKWATLIFPLFGLATLQYENWLRSRHRDLFGITTTVLTISYLIVAGTFGYIYVPSKEATEVASAPGAQTTTRSQAPTQQPSTTAPQPKSRYSPAEKEDLKNAMRDISKVINDHDLLDKINEALVSWDRLSAPSGIPELSTRLDDLVGSISRLRTSLDYQDGIILKQYGSYSQEIKSVLDRPPNWQSDPVSGLHVVTNRFKESMPILVNASKCSDEKLFLWVRFNIGGQELKTAQKAFVDWITRTNQRIDNFRNSFL